VSFFSRFSASSPERMEKRYYKEQAEAIERVFGKSVDALCKLFPMTEPNLRDIGSSDPQDKYLDKLGVNALVHTEEIAIEQFPLMMSLLSKGREEVSLGQFQRHADAQVKTTLLATEDRFSGKTVRLLTNDIELLKSIAQANFSPPPPWVVWHELGPDSAIERQGNVDFWYRYVWDKFWNRLSLDEQGIYLAEWREKTKHISDSEWNDWVMLVRMRDPKYRNAQDE